jgi:hypothetical protein
MTALVGLVRPWRPGDWQYQDHAIESLVVAFAIRHVIAGLAIFGRKGMAGNYKQESKTAADSERVCGLIRPIRQACKAHFGPVRRFVGISFVDYACGPGCRLPPRR